MTYHSNCKCSICDSLIDQDNGDIVGYFGSSKVAFCVWCLSSMHDMIIKLYGYNEIEILEEKILELKNE
jgi:hypothetical protein